MVVERERERESYSLTDRKVSKEDTLFIMEKDKLTQRG